MDYNTKYADDEQRAPPPYTSVGMPMPTPWANHPTAGAGMVPDVGFSQGLAGQTTNAGFMPPMGFHVPMEPDENNGHNDLNKDGQNLVSDPDFDRLNFSEKTIRMAFIRKVYSILMVQLLVTTGIITLFCYHEGVKYWVQNNIAFTFASYGIAIALLIVIACCESVRRKSPANIILLGLFTLTYGIVIGTITSLYDVESVVLAAGITVVVCLALTVFSFQTKWDFTTFGGMLFVGLVILFVFGIITPFLRNSFPIVHIVYAAAGAMLFSFYLIYDTQLMIGGNHKYSISPEEYIFAALNIYTDVIMIFLKILSLVGNRN